MNSATGIVLSPHERLKLDTWARGRSLPLRLILHARIIQMAAKGALNQQIAKKAKRMILHYPNNPTGGGAPVEFFQKVVEFAKA